MKKLLNKIVTKLKWYDAVIASPAIIALTVSIL